MYYIEPERARLIAAIGIAVPLICINLALKKYGKKKSAEYERSIRLTPQAEVALVKQLWEPTTLRMYRK